MKYREGISETGRRFVPLLFAGDINIYSVARAFNEAYGCVAKGYGKARSIFCMDSNILDYSCEPKADEPETFRKLVEAFAAENSEKTVILMGCGDSYVELASRFRDELPPNVIAPYIDVELMHRLQDKEQFYALCARTGVDYPLTFVHRNSMGADFELPFGGPFIVKPADGIEYWKHPYPTQKKVYKVETFSEVKSVLGDIYGAGYGGAVIIQHFIPGDDSFMRVLTSYSDRNGKVTMMCLGHVLLEEHTPHGIGNHAVILTETDKELMERYKALLEELHYVGFSNFDIKYDSGDGKFKAFEINTRQGRSNYYVTASGANIARCVVRDRIDGADEPLELVDTDSLWMVTPHRVAFDYVKGDGYKAEMKRLIAEGKVKNPLLNPAETSLKRKLRIMKNQLGHYYKFAKYLGK